MLILGEKEICPYNKRCPNKKHEGPETGICDGLNPFRNTVFKCELVRNDGTIENLEFRREKTLADAHAECD
jgi:hypothetical protein